MKILQVITSLQTGGAETLVCNMTLRLIALGHEVDICVFNGIETPLMKRLNSENIKIYSLGNAYYNPLYIFKLIRIVRKYDIVHTHNSSPQLFAAIANIFCGKKLVTTEHSTNNRKREKGGILRYVDKWMYKRYESVICISKIAQTKLESYLKTKSDKPVISTINNGVDVMALNQSDSIKRATIGSDERNFVAVMVAGFREAKDQDTVIKAIGLLPNDIYELWLVGDGVRRSELESLINKDNLGDRVKMLGLRTDVPCILRAADVVVMSSHWEGLSLSNIEGMSVGKPFVASDVDGLREVTKNYGLLFPHGDARALASIIMRLHDDKTFYKQIADSCFKRAQQYDIKKTVDEYLSVYEKLVVK